MNEYSEFCLFGVLPLLIGASYVTRYWQPESNFVSKYFFDFISVSNLANWLFGDAKQSKQSATLESQFLMAEHITPSDQELTQRRENAEPTQHSPEAKKQASEEMAVLLGEAFNDYMESKRELAKKGRRVTGQPSPQPEDATPTAEHQTTQPPTDNVVPLFDDMDINDIGNTTLNNNVDDFTGLIEVDGEQYQLSEEETQMIKDSYRAALNTPSNARERMYRDFLERFYQINFDKGVAHLVIELSALRIEARNLLIIETNYGNQYRIENDELQIKAPQSDTTE